MKTGTHINTINNMVYRKGEDGFLIHWMFGRGWMRSCMTNDTMQCTETFKPI